MSITPSITYNEIINLVVSWITTNCLNLRSDWNTNNAYSPYRNGSIKDVGVSQTRWLDHVGDNNNGTTYRDRSNATARLTVAGGIIAVNSSNVNTDIKAFFSELGLTQSKLNYPVDDKNLYPFVRNIIYFCSRKVCWAISCLPTANTVYIMGISGNGNNQPSATVQSVMTKVLVYNSATISGGTSMDPQPEGTTDELIIDNGIVVGSSRKHTLNAGDMANIVTEILNNRLSYKILGTTCNSSIV